MNSNDMKFREASSGNPKMVDASAKVDDSSTNSIENIDFEATTAAQGVLLVSWKRACARQAQTPSNKSFLPAGVALY